MRGFRLFFAISALAAFIVTRCAEQLLEVTAFAAPEAAVRKRVSEESPAP